MPAMKWFGLIALTLASTVSLIQCPHSKVEESFNLQATHDLYYHGLAPAIQSTFKSQNDASVVYDHLQYPGVVPRTFLGPLIIATVLKLLSMALRPFFHLDDHPLLVQSFARGILLLFNLHAHYRLAKAASAKFTPSKGFLVGGYFLLITASQFHLPFYASRMLPNTFALGLVTHAYAEWIRSNFPRAIVLMVFCTAIFRCDILILLFTFGLTLLIRREVTVFQAIKIGMTTVIVALIVTVPLDSIMWQRLVWPEAEVLCFNAVENKSSEYGVSPCTWYVVKALPKGLLLTLPLVSLAFVRIPQRIARFKVRLWDFEGLPYFLPVVGFIALYSILPHKEIRFIFVAFPMFNVMAAKAMANLHVVAKTVWNEDVSARKVPLSLTSKLAIGLLYLCGMIAIGLSLVGSLIFMQVSRTNYPGGDALAILSRELGNTSKSNESIDIFVDVASAMTGVSLFGQEALMQSCHAKQCNIIKGGYEDENEHDGILSSGRFDYMLSEKSHVEGYDVVDAAKGHPRIDMRRGGIISSDDTIFVLKKV